MALDILSIETTLRGKAKDERSKADKERARADIEREKAKVPRTMVDSPRIGAACHGSMFFPLLDLPSIQPYRATKSSSVNSGNAVFLLYTTAIVNEILTISLKLQGNALEGAWNPVSRSTGS